MSSPVFADKPLSFGQGETGNAPNLKDVVMESTSSGPDSPLGFKFEKGNAARKFVLTPEYSSQGRFSATGAFGNMLSDNAAIGGVLTVGSFKKEAIFNAGYRNSGQQVVLTLDQMRQKLNFDFDTGRDRAEMTQSSAAISYKFQLGKDIRRYVEVNGYGSRTGSKSLGSTASVLEDPNQFELWDVERRVAGGRVYGIQGQLGFAPFATSALRTSLGGEQLQYDYASGKTTTKRLTGGVEWKQQIFPGFNLTATGNQFASERRYRLGVERCLADGQHLGLDLIHILGRDGAPSDRQVKLTWAISLGGRSSCAPVVPPDDSAPSLLGRSLLDQVAMRPDFLPSQVVATPDKTAVRKRVVAVDKTALPPGATIDNRGVISIPTGGVCITTISSVSLNGATFNNAGQFTAACTSILINTSQFPVPAAGTTSVYTALGSSTTACAAVVTATFNAAGGLAVSGVGVAGCDTTPNPFNFTGLTNVALNTLVASNPITVTGINAPSPIGIAGGEFQINGGAWLKLARAKVGETVKNGDVVTVRHTSSVSNSTTVTTTLTIGGVSGSFSSTTVAPNAPPAISNLPSFPLGIKSGAIQQMSVTISDDKPWGGASAESVTAASGSISGFASGAYGTINFTYTAPLLPIRTPPITEILTFSVTDSEGATTAATVTFTVY
jgi:hypothetical protein